MSQQSIVYNLLVSPRFRVLRYITLVTFFTIVNLNQALVGYEAFIPQMGNNVYWIVIGTILIYMIVVYFFFRKVLKDLSKGMYTQFVLSTIACALFFTAIGGFVYYIYQDDYNLFSNATIIDNLSAFTIYLFCISGVFIPVFIRNWMTSNQHLNHLKVKQKNSQVEQLKEQINPSSFFEVLNKSRSLVKSEPERASAMLMKLGQLLRYQLYDCNRAQVLLNAEISFLRNFLELKKLYSPTFNYSLVTTGNINGIFMAPTILLPYVQSMINETENSEEQQNIDIQVENFNDTINITLNLSGNDDAATVEKKLVKVKERLDTLYANRYGLIVYGNDSVSKIVSLNLDKE